MAIPQTVSVLFAALLLSACALKSPRDLPAPQDLPEPSNERVQRSPEKDEIRPGYLISIRHSLDRKLQLDARVGRDGVLKLPYGRQLQTEGMTTEVLRTELRKTYGDLFRADQEFTVRIAEKKFWVETRGLIKKPGFKLISEDATLEELLRTSEPSDEQTDFARIEWGGRAQWIDLKQYSAGLWPSEKSPVWIGGETVWFVRGEPQFLRGSSDIRLLGEVGQPGAYTYQNGKSFLDYLSLAGGPRPMANLERIYLYRQGQIADGPAEFSLLKPLDFQLAPGDTLLIVSERQDMTERRFQMGANIAAILSAIGILLIAL